MKFLLIFLFAFCYLVSFSQCENNLIKNGSFELDSVGTNITGQYWDNIGTPDIDNANDSFPNIGGNTVWSDVIINSCDGGNWQNISGIVSLSGNITLEAISQKIQLDNSTPHSLEFEFTAQSITPSFPGKGFAAIDVFIDNSLFFTTPIDSTLFTWEKYSVTFIPKSDEILIEFKINPSLSIEQGKTKYIAIDGVCLTPIKTGMFCEP